MKKPWQLSIATMVAITAALSLAWEMGLLRPRSAQAALYVESNADGSGLVIQDYLSWDSGRKPARLTGKTLLVVMGPCGSCTVRAYKPGMEQQGTYSQVILVYEGQGNKVKGVPKLDAPYFVAFDRTGKLRELLNASSLPRPYELDSDWRAIYAETHDGGRRLVAWP